MTVEGSCPDEWKTSRSSSPETREWRNASTGTESLVVEVLVKSSGLAGEFGLEN